MICKYLSIFKILILDNNNVNLDMKYIFLFIAVVPFFLSCQEAKETKKYNVAMSDSEWENILPQLSYNVLRKSFTEPAFSSSLNFNKKSGYYACRGCKKPLYSSENKYDSGSGWPSFDREIKNNIEIIKIKKFLKLTKQEEEAGLYEDTSRIGTKHFWEELLLKKKLEIKGHKLIYK